MEVKVLGEYGYEFALYGFSLSYKDRAIPRDEWWCPLCLVFEPCPKKNESEYEYECNICDLEKRKNKIENACKVNAFRDGGHNKLLEHIVVWLDVEASLEFWKQLDTYRVGVSKQSESTMHVLDKRDINLNDLDLAEDDLKWLEENSHDSTIVDYLDYISKMPSRLKSKLLPQGYKQRREMVLSYKVLRHIINQRKGHKLSEWQFFIKSILKQIQHPELLPNPYGEVNAS